MGTDISLQRTCYACPEQYDAIDEAGEVVGYLRLRHGYFTVQMGGPDGPEVYSAQPEGDGIFTDEERQGYLDAATGAIRASLAVASAISGEPVTEYGQVMSGGGYEIRWADPQIEEIYPTRDWIANQRRHGGHVYRRRIIVVEDWAEVDEAEVP
jgi:hypothetical protein